MNKFNALDMEPDTKASYMAWKKKEDPTKPKEINVASFTEFPDLVKEVQKKSVFEGTSLAAKLKETIAAEEEAAILKRLKKGDTPEMILREGCVSLPYKGKAPEEPFAVPWWVTDTTNPIIIPPFKHKTMEELAQERYWRRIGVNPKDTMLFDEPESLYIPDRVSLPDDNDYMSDAVSEPDYVEQS